MNPETNTEQPTLPEPPTPEEGPDRYPPPKGAFVFVIVMLIGFILYWAFIWLTVMGRGAGA